MKRALAIGLNSYTKQKSLRGAVNDASLITDLLRYRFNFDHVSTALDAITKLDFIHAFQDLLTVLPGETGQITRIFYFAGHGASVIDDSHDETDFIDEVLCLPHYSWDDPDSFIRDDELAGFLNSAKQNNPALNIVCILDCCHSGTGTRDTAAQWRDLIHRHETDLPGVSLALDDPRLALYTANREANSQPTKDGYEYTARRIGSGGATNQEKMSHLLISASSDAQKAKEAEIDGTPHGVFTIALTKAADKNPKLTYGDLHNAIAQELSSQLDQVPQIEGPKSAKNARLFE